MTEFYAVYANHEDRRRFLSFATGKVEDIREFFADRKCYGLDVERAQVVNVTPDAVNKKRELLSKRASLESQMNAINKELKESGYSITGCM